jgi:hypothetical protein
MLTRDRGIAAMASGMAVSESMFSFFGIFALFHTTPVLFVLSTPAVLALLSAGLSGLIEYDVYKQNIYQVMNFSLENHLARNFLMSQYLDKHVEKNNFLSCYRNQRKILSHLEHNPNNNAEIVAAKQRIKCLEDLFIYRIQNDDPAPAEDNLKDSIALLITTFDKEAIKTHMASKKKKEKFLRGLSGLAGIAFGFSTYYGLYALPTISGLPAILLSMTPGFFAVIGIMAALGSGYMAYRIFSYALYNTIYHSKKSFLTLLLTGLAIFGAIAAVYNMYNYIPFIFAGASILHVIIIAGLAGLLASTFLYSLVNARESLKHAKDDFGKWARKTKDALLKSFTAEINDVKKTFSFDSTCFNWLYLPIRLIAHLLRIINIPFFISKIFYPLLFLGHIIAVGASSVDSQFSKVAAWAAAIANVLLELLTEFHQLFHKGCSSHQHFDANESDNKESTHNTPKEKTIAVLAKPMDELTHEHTSNLIVDASERLFNGLAIGWDFFFTLLITVNYKEARKHAVENYKYPAQASFSCSGSESESESESDLPALVSHAPPSCHCQSLENLTHSEGHRTDNLSSPVLDQGMMENQFQKYRKLDRLNKEIVRCTPTWWSIKPTLLARKQAALINIRNTSQIDVPADSPIRQHRYPSIFGPNSIFGLRKPPKSAAILTSSLLPAPGVKPHNH